jgi:glycosyltransferase 2 family protein
MALPAAISLGFGYLALRRVDLDRFTEGLRQVDPIALILALLGIAAGMVLRAIRWRSLFPPFARPPLAAVLRAVLVGYLFDSVLLMRSGEAARIVFLHRETGVSRAQALGTAVVERLADVVVVIGLLLCATPFLPKVDWLSRAAVLAVAALVAAGVLALVFRNDDARGRRLLDTLLRRLPFISNEQADRMGSNLSLGLACLRQPRVIVQGLGLTIAAWLASLLSYAVVVSSFGLAVGLGAALLVLVAVSLAAILPSLPASLGVFEAAAVLALSIYGVDQSSALACAVVLHALIVFPAVIAGYVVLQLHFGARRRSLDVR